MRKKNVLISFGKVTEEIRNEIFKRYPFGIKNQLIDLNTGDSAKALLLEYPDCVYLIRFSGDELDQFDQNWEAEDDNDQMYLDSDYSFFSGEHFEL